MRAIIYWFSNHTLSIFAILIFIALFFWVMRFQNQLRLGWKEAVLTAFLHVAIGWPIMRLMAILEVGGDLERAANIRLYGAIFTLPILYYAAAKWTQRKVPMVMDAAAICVIIGAISGRLNCLTTGCCDGIPILADGTLRWPLRQIELLYYFSFMTIYCKKIEAGKTYGQVYPVYLLSYGILRFILEFLREEFTTQIGIFHLAHIWSLISIAVGAVVYYKVRLPHKNNLRGRKRCTAGADQPAAEKGGNSK